MSEFAEKVPSVGDFFHLPLEPQIRLSDSGIIHMSEKIYECEVKRLFRREDRKVWEWKKMAVADAIADGASEFRCKDCHGAVKLHGKHVSHGPAPHIEHKHRQDSEYCIAGMYFRQHPGRDSRLSQRPVA
jgi:hypothetical protein